MLFSCARLLSARWPGAAHQVVSYTCLDQTRPGIRWSSRTPNKSRKIRRSLPIAMSVGPFKMAVSAGPSPKHQRLNAKTIVQRECLRTLILRWLTRLEGFLCASILHGQTPLLPS
jgi:hypothetical protein